VIRSGKCRHRRSADHHLRRATDFRRPLYGGPTRRIARL
jgi:hypothetical protein